MYSVVGEGTFVYCREDDDEEDEDAKSMMPITSFFSNSQQTHGIKRHHFFKERQLEQVTSL